MLLVLAILLAPPSSGAADTPSNALPRFERAACPVEVAPDERIDCGALFVPENRDKTGSRAIRLPVMIFRSRSASPAPDPLVFITGGPGNSSVAGRRSGKEIPFLDDRDFIVLEQRGTRYAQPSLECPEISVTDKHEVRGSSRISTSHHRRRHRGVQPGRTGRQRRHVDDAGCVRNSVKRTPTLSTSCVRMRVLLPWHCVPSAAHHHRTYRKPSLPLGRTPRYVQTSQPFGRVHPVSLENSILRR